MELKSHSNTFSIGRIIDVSDISFLKLSLKFSVYFSRHTLIWTGHSQRITAIGG